MAEDNTVANYYEKKLELDREYYAKRLEMEFAHKKRKPINEQKRWKEFEQSAGVAAAAATMTFLSAKEAEGIETGVAAATTICAGARATGALVSISGAKTLNFVRSIFQD